MTGSARRPRASALYGLCGAYLVSGTGTAMSAVAIPWLVLVSTGSAAATGIVGFAQMAPYVTLQATAGPLVDRLGLRRSFVLGNTVAALAVSAVPLLHALGHLSLGTLAALVAVAGTVRGLADSATSPLVPTTAALGGVPPERAAGIYSAANRTALLVGMPVAGVLVAVAGAPAVVLVDAVTFAAAAAIVLATVPAAAGPGEGPAGRFSARAYVAELAEGFRFIGADRLLLGMAAAIAVGNLLDEALVGVLLPVWAHDRAHHASALGLVGGALAVGMLVGALVMAWLGPRLPRRLTCAVGFLVSASPPFFAPALSSSAAPLVPLLVVCGLAGGVMNPIIGAVQYERIPPRLQARVLGATKASAWLGIPFGSLLGGLLAESAGLTGALVGCGCAMLLASLAPFVFPAWRGLDRAQRVEPAEEATPVAGSRVRDVATG